MTNEEKIYVYDRQIPNGSLLRVNHGQCAVVDLDGMRHIYGEGVALLHSDVQLNGRGGAGQGPIHIRIIYINTNFTDLEMDISYCVQKKLRVEIPITVRMNVSSSEQLMDVNFNWLDTKLLTSQLEDIVKRQVQEGVQNTLRENRHVDLGTRRNDEDVKAWLKEVFSEDERDEIVDGVNEYLVRNYGIELDRGGLSIYISAVRVTWLNESVTVGCYWRGGGQAETFEMEIPQAEYRPGGSITDGRHGVVLKWCRNCQLYTNDGATNRCIKCGKHRFG